MLKRNSTILTLANLMKFSDTEITEYSELPLINGNREILLAILFQNMMHPKNHQRREAVASKQYVEILTESDATNYLSTMLSNNLKNEFSGKES